MSTFPRQERLNSRKRIEFLVTQGRKLHVPPFRIAWCLSDSAPGTFQFEAAFSVPKRKHKKAARRNRIKRKMKEAFRLNKEPFRENCAQQQQTLSLLLVYTPKKELDYAAMEKAMREVFRLLEKEIKSQTQQPPGLFKR